MRKMGARTSISVPQMVAQTRFFSLIHFRSILSGLHISILADISTSKCSAEYGLSNDTRRSGLAAREVVHNRLRHGQNRQKIKTPPTASARSTHIPGRFWKYLCCSPLFGGVFEIVRIELAGRLCRQKRDGANPYLVPLAE